MKRKKILVAALLTAISITTLAFAIAGPKARASLLAILDQTGPVQTAKSVAPHQTAATLNNSANSSVSSTKKTSVAPAQGNQAQMEGRVTYLVLFRFAAYLEKEDQKAAAKGEIAGDFNEFFKKRANLNQEQSDVFRQIATACMEEVKQTDALALEAIEQERKILKQMAPPRPGEPMPPIPAELVALQARRDSAILRARDQLKESLGESKFTEFKSFIEKEIAPNISLDEAEQKKSAFILAPDKAKTGQRFAPQEGGKNQ